MKDRYLNVDDPRDKSEFALASSVPEPPPAIRAEPPPEAETPAAPPEGETDRCLRVMREVFLGQPGPHDLVVGVAEVERRLKGGGG